MNPQRIVIYSFPWKTQSSQKNVRRQKCLEISLLICSVCQVTPSPQRFTSLTFPPPLSPTLLNYHLSLLPYLLFFISFSFPLSFWYSNILFFIFFFKEVPLQLGLMLHPLEVLLMVVVHLTTLPMANNLLNSNMVKRHPNQDMAINHPHSKDMEVPRKDMVVTNNLPKDSTHHPTLVGHHHPTLVSHHRVHHSPQLKKHPFRRQKLHLQ